MNHNSAAEFYDPRVKRYYLIPDQRTGLANSYNFVGTMYGHVVDAMGSTKVNFRLPDDLVEKADVAAEVSRKNRTDIVKEALQEYLEEIEDDEKFKEAIVELYLDDQISFDTLKEFIGRQDAESVRASKTILDQDEDLADELAEL